MDIHLITYCLNVHTALTTLFLPRSVKGSLTGQCPLSYVTVDEREIIPAGGRSHALAERVDKQEAAVTTGDLMAALFQILRPSKKEKS